jgi:mono/diheme cytochrome c family protein
VSPFGRHVITVLLSLGLLPASGYTLERPESATDVAQNYLLFCGGCHGDGGRGVPHKVPALAGKIGRYLRVDGGREFLVRVPGVANSQLSDAAAAAVMNLCLEKFTAPAERAGVAPYTASDIATARRQPMLEVERMRHVLLAQAGVSDAEIAGDY